MAWEPEHGEDASGTNRESLIEELLLRVTGDEPDLVEELLAAHPDEAQLLAGIRNAHDALLPALKECIARRHADGLKTRSSGDPACGSPTRIPGYRLMEEIGHGCMGRVFKAEQIATGRLVALKVLMARSTPALRQRFLREIEVIRRLRNQRIVSILGSGSYDGGLFYAMELLEGETLAARIDQWRTEGLSAARRYRAAVEIVASLCSPLDLVHSEGVIHRDLKPGNVFLTRSGEVKLIDFGLARDLEAPSITGTGAVVGTVAYMSPEQLLGERHRIGRRSDIYSLGATLYEAVILKRPFQGEEESPRLLGILSGGPASPRQVDPNVPADLSAIVEKAMEFEPWRRYATAGDMARDLRAFLDGEPVTAKPVGPWGRLRRRLDRRRKLVAGLATILLLALLGSIALGSYTARSERNRAATTALRDAAATAIELRELFSDSLPAARKHLEEMESQLGTTYNYEARGPLLEARAKAHELETKARERWDAAVLVCQRGLEIDAGNGALRALLLDLLWAAYLRAEESGDEKETRRLHAQILSHAPAFAERLVPRARVSISSDPPGARVYLFRYQRVGLLLQPVPYLQSRGLACNPDDLPAPALRIVKPVGLLLDAWGVRLGDRILTIGGKRIGVSGNRTWKEMLLQSSEPSPKGRVEAERDGNVLAFQFPEALAFDLSGKVVARSYTPSPPRFSEEKSALLLNACSETDVFPLALLDGAVAGTTPLQAIGIEAGSYLLLLKAPGFKDTRVPFVVRRGAALELRARLYRPHEIPEGFAHVPAGATLLGGDKMSFYPESARNVSIDDFFIQRYEVAAQEYYEYLNDPATKAEIEAMPEPDRNGILPTEIRGNKATARYRIEPDGRYGPIDVKSEAWSIRWISRLGADRYVRWINQRAASRGDPWTFALPLADELEKAARGADGRNFPWGNDFDWSLVCSYHSAFDPVDRCIEFSTDTSPYDVRNLCGSLAEITRTDQCGPGDNPVMTHPENLDYRAKCGSAFDDIEPYFHATSYTLERKRDTSYRLGFRLVAYSKAAAAVQK